jgi:hypothetical protein
MNFGLGVGYNLNENIAFELSCNTQFFTKSQVNNDWSQYFQASSVSLSGINGQVSLRNKSIQLAPLFIYTIKVNKIKPYIKVGVNFLFNQTSYEESYSWRTLTSTDFIESASKETGKWNIGFRGAFGASLQVNQKLYVYGEFVTVNTNYNFLKSKLNTYKVNGSDQLSTIDNKETTYQNNSGLIDYSHIGLNIGIRYVMNKN